MSYRSYAPPSTVRTAPCAPSGRAAGGTDPARRPAPACRRVAGTPVRDEPFGEVLDARRERAGFGRAEQAPVLLHARAAARAVDDDGRRPGIDAMTRRARRARFGVAARVHVQRAAARPARGRSRDCVRRRRASTRAVVRWVSRIQASMTQPVNSHASGRHRRGTSSGRRPRRVDARDPEPARHEVQPLPRASRHHVADEQRRDSGSTSGTRPTRPGGAAAAVRRCGSTAARVSSIRWPNCTPDGHAASQPRHCTHSFIARQEGVVDRRAALLDCAHRRDAPPRRRDLEAGDAVGRAVRQAQPARDAGDELVLVEPQRRGDTFGGSQRQPPRRELARRDRRRP